jgi:hypothetical protein
MMKDITIETIKKSWMNAKKIDIVKESTNLFMDITLKCMFGAEFEHNKITQIINGEKKQVPLGESILMQTECSFRRIYQIHLILVQELLPFYISRFDRELTFNC